MAALYAVENLDFTAMDGRKSNNAVDTTFRPIAYLNTGDSLPVIITGLSRLDMVNGLRSDGKTPYRLCTNSYASGISTDAAKIITTVVPDPLGLSVSTIPAIGATYETQVDALVVAANNNGIQAGMYQTAWMTHNPTPANYVFRIYYPQALAASPQVVVILSGFLREPASTVDISVSPENVHTSFFDLRVQSVVGDIYQVSVGWLAFPNNAPDVYAGVDHMFGSPWGRHITFPVGKFFTPPKVLVALNGFDFGGLDLMRLQTAANNVTAAGFAWSATTWANSLLNEGAVTNIAFAQ